MKSVIKLSSMVKLSLFLGMSLQAPQAKAKEQTRIETTQAALQLSHTAQNQIWKGFNLNNYPLIYYTPQKGYAYALLFNYPKAKAPYPYLPVLGHGGVYETLTVKPYPEPFGFDYPIGDAKGIVMSTQMSTVTLVHEAFHKYQDSKSFFNKKTMHNTEYDPEDVALAQLEQKALLAALQADNAKMKAHIHTFLNLRNTRNLKHSQSLTDNENSLEAVEGTAFYVQNHFSQAAYQAKIAEASPNLYQSKETLQKELIEILSMPLDKGLTERFRYYLTGFAMGQLLDRLNSPWQTQVESGATLVSLMQSASNYTKPEQTVLFEVLNSPKFKTQKAKQTAYLNTLKEKTNGLVEAFKKSQGQRIEVNVHHKYPVATSTSESVTLAENHELVNKEATVSVESQPAVSLFLKGPMEQIMGQAYTFVFYANKLDQLKVNGSSVLTKTGTFTGAIEFKAGGNRVQAQKARLVINEKGIQITLLE